MLRRSFVMMTMTAGGAVSVVTAVMRGRLAVRLRLDYVGRRFRSGLHGRWVQSSEGQGRRYRKQKDIQSASHETISSVM
jgi:hypothetical protein